MFCKHDKLKVFDNQGFIARFGAFRAGKRNALPAFAGRGNIKLSPYITPSILTLSSQFPQFHYI